MGAVVELWTQEWDFDSDEFRVERWINGGYFTVIRKDYFNATDGRILTKCDI